VPPKLREERLAENEIVFLKINERIQQVEGERWGWNPIDFICECADATCTAVIALTQDEYKHLRSVPTRFAVLPGHEVPTIERVVEVRPTYLVVEKHAEGARSS
jgi:hypothetical protein